MWGSLAIVASGMRVFVHKGSWLVMPPLRSWTAGMQGRRCGDDVWGSLAKLPRKDICGVYHGVKLKSQHTGGWF